jgi:hypothetical protein
MTVKAKSAGATIRNGSTGVGFNANEDVADFHHLIYAALEYGHACPVNALFS